MPGQRSERKARKLDRAKVRELAAQGLSTADIARHQRVTPSTVWRFLERLKPERQAIEHFKTHRADLFARVQARELDLKERILDSLGGDRMFNTLTAHQKTALYRTLTISNGTMYDKERLERGASTQNISVFTKLIEEAHKNLFKDSAEVSPVAAQEKVPDSLPLAEG